MNVIPALLTKTADDLFRQVQKLLPFYPHFQIDIADGVFVPNTTVQLPAITQQLLHSPNHYSDKTEFDIHLMVQDWEKELYHVEKLSSMISINTVFIHHGVLSNYREIQNKPYNYTIGVVMNPEDRIQDIASYESLKAIPSIQIMTVHPGFQGSSFLPEMLNKILLLREENYKGKIYLDGAINNKTLPVINQLKWKPDYLGVGSFLSKADNIQEQVDFLRQFENH